MSYVINRVPRELLEDVALMLEAYSPGGGSLESCAAEDIRALLTAQPRARAAQPAPVVPFDIERAKAILEDASGVIVDAATIEECRDRKSHVGKAVGLLNELDALLTAAPAQGRQVEFGDAYQGAREDLAIWKRRALEAEEKVRQQDSIIDHLTLEAQGETRAELSALKAQQVGQEPVARKTWRAGNPSYLCHRCGTPLMQHDQQIFCPTGPAFASSSTAPQPAPAQDVAGWRLVGYTTAGMLAIAEQLPLIGRIGARCKADERWNVPLYTRQQQETKK